MMVPCCSRAADLHRMRVAHKDLRLAVRMLWLDRYSSVRFLWDWAGQASRVAAAQQRLLDGGASAAVPLLTDGREGGRGPPLAQRLRLQPGEGSNPLPTEVCTRMITGCAAHRTAAAALICRQAAG